MMDESGTKQDFKSMLNQKVSKKVKKKPYTPWGKVK